MRYNRTVEARFVSRPNRFIAQVELDGKIETAHVKNTGRCKELLLPNSRVILSEAKNPARKTRYDLIAVEKAGLGLVNIDSQAPNKIMAEWLAGHAGGKTGRERWTMGVIYPFFPCSTLLISSFDAFFSA